jgi:hypothetical protein
MPDSTSTVPNEVFVALALMLVGTHRVEPTAAAIVSTVRRIASDNASARAPADRCTNAAGTWCSPTEACASARATGTCFSVMLPRA